MADTNAMVIGVDDYDADLILTQSGASHLVNAIIPLAKIMREEAEVSVPKSVMVEALKELKHGLRMSGILHFMKLQTPNEE
jgi:hypothetical protein